MNRIPANLIPCADFDREAKRLGVKDCLFQGIFEHDFEYGDIQITLDLLQDNYLLPPARIVRVHHIQDTVTLTLADLPAAIRGLFTPRQDYLERLTVKLLDNTCFGICKDCQAKDICDYLEYAKDHDHNDPDREVSIFDLQADTLEERCGI